MKKSKIRLFTLRNAQRFLSFRSHSQRISLDYSNLYFNMLTEVPVLPTIVARITFQDFEWNDNLEDSLFVLPPGYKVIGLLFLKKRNPAGYHGVMSTIVSITSQPAKSLKCNSGGESFC